MNGFGNTTPRSNYRYLRSCWSDVPFIVLHSRGAPYASSDYMRPYPDARRLGNLLYDQLDIYNWDYDKHAQLSLSLPSAQQISRSSISACH
ncbi:uncharacterized protein N7483_006345 [Penicillium malachiteum]|uniref:uncharacterized protein n=1 Tax=Penicillium malachiteum TaxID=1324776 RepID=UPI0025468121|nr:uncharacterized protein N7483_006345 [Penicillium malachiteum]KAJ5724988.1 hypothetical protein N7483_006345 [Penicillium malachiteum]